MSEVKKKILRMWTSIIVMIAMCASLPLKASAADDLLQGFSFGDKVTYANGPTLVGSDGKAYTSQLSDKKRFAYCILKRGEKIWCYCVEREKLNPSSGSTKYEGYRTIAGLSQKQQDALEIALLYSRQPGDGSGRLNKILGINDNNATGICSII